MPSSITQYLHISILKMQALQSTSPKNDGTPLDESPFQLIRQDSSNPNHTSSHISINSNEKNYEGSSQQDCFSPLRKAPHKPSVLLEKRSSFEVVPSSDTSLKKTQSETDIKHSTKTAEKRLPDSPAKLTKAVSLCSSPLKKFSVRGVDFPLMEGEDLLGREECLMLVGTERYNGFLIITNYRVLFLEGHKYLFDIPLGFIAGVDRQVEQKPVTWSKVEITTKFGKMFKFRFNTQPEASNQVYKILRKYSSGDITTLFAFAYARCQTPKFEIEPFNIAKEKKKPRTGWEMNLIEEFERMGVTTDEGSLFKRVNNSHGKLCLSYPPEFIVTKRVKDETLGKCLKARTRERVPVLSYYHQDSKTKKVSCLWRAAQCRGSTLNATRNFSDEEYVKCLALEQNKQKSQMLLVYDIRTKATNQAIFYQNSLVKQVNDLHSLLLMKQNFNKLASSYQNDASTKWVNIIQDSKWFQQIWKLLSYAEEIALKMKNGNPILVQCPDGSDRSAQLCTLVQLLLCPYYRTIEGFQTLINKEFVWMGYPFADRLRGPQEQRVPTLIQLLDCVHQLTIAFPLSFQFNSKYLASLGDALYNNKYGNFITSSHIQFINKNISQFALSFWNRDIPDIEINAYFKKNYLFLESLLPVPAIASLRLFHEFLEILGGGNNKCDLYRIHPNAEKNRDYLILRHNSLKHENFQFKVLVEEQDEEIRRLRERLEKEDGGRVGVDSGKGKEKSEKGGQDEEGRK